MTTLNKAGLRRNLLASTGLLALAFVLATPNASAVVPNDNQTPEDIVDDTENVNGVGMFFRDDGFVCTGTLINPRTVLFAAHCVNDLPMGDYGTTTRSAWSFETNALPGFQDWLSNGFASNPNLYVYDVNQIIYNLDSLADPSAFGFLEGDIALSSLATPASNVPTWALLFSPLPDPGAIDPVTGTGYHVNITGYGRSGSGTGGATTGIDFRRRAAENMLGALTSFDDRNTFLFGAPFGDLPSVLYRLDFDDPSQSNPFDFNLYRDEALANEGTTAGGDSGGPLILDAANNTLSNEDLVIGVLSGGSRFFGPQAFSSYGTESFYQPLFLYWDWIAANNPYRYVGANAGDGNWEDNTHWTSLLDPNYRVIDASGAVVNGIPTNPGAATEGTEPQFGEVCFDLQPRGQGAATGDSCLDLATGNPVVLATVVDNGLGGAQAVGTLTTNGLTSVSLDGASDGASSGHMAMGVENASQAGGFTDDPLPAPTIDNGLAGATDFVPGNVDPNVAAAINARYFDVTLSAAGTTTLSSTVTIDRLSITGAESGLNVGVGGNLTSLIDIMHLTGNMNVDGTVSTPGDYLFMTGLLSGSGTINTPYLTNIMGTIAPGGLGSIGSLTINCNVILSSGSLLMIDTSGGSNDVLDVTGDISLGGIVGISNMGQAPRHGDQATFLNYGGVASGGFDGAAGLGNGVLQAIFSDTGGSISYSIQAGSLLDFLSLPATGTQLSYGAALDQARSTNYASLMELYDVVDLLGPGELAAAFDMISPSDSVIAGQGGLASADALSVRLNTRLRDIRGGERGFVVNGSANSLQVASNDAMSSFSLLANQMAATGTNTTTESSPMKEGYGGFANIDFYNGDADSSLAGRTADIEGLAVTVGIDRMLDNGAVLGAMASYNSSDNTFSGGLGGAELSGATVGVYGYYPLSNAFYVEGHASYGSHSIDTTRTAPITSILTASGDTDATQVMFGASVGRAYQYANGVNLTPSASILHATYDIDGYTETGSSIALDIASRDLTTTQLSVGAELDWTLGRVGKFRPNIGAAAIYDLDGSHDVVLGTLVNAPGSSVVSVTGPDRTKTWLELEAGLDIDLSEKVVGSIGVKQNVGRDELTFTVFGANLQVKF